MKLFFSSLLGGLFALIAFFGILVLAFIGLVSSFNQEPPIPEKIVLYYDMREPMTDQAPIKFLQGTESIGHIDVVIRMKAAESDDRVVGMYIRVSEEAFLPARAEEMRDAIKSFQEAGKWVIAYGQDIYAPSMPSAYLAVAAADELWMQPETSLVMFGVAGFSTFYGGLFELLDSSAEFVTAFEYKNAANTYTESGYTAPHREQMQAWISSLWETSAAHIAGDRGMSVAELQEALNSVLSSEKAKTHGLISAEYWPEEAEDAVLDKAGVEADFVDISAYGGRMQGEGPTIAIVGGEGVILTGYIESLQLNDYTTFRSDYIAEQILEAGKSFDVDALVFRVDSGGGSATASAQIGRALERVQTEFDKPVIVSMGGVAASGGYWVAAKADKIVANPTTITGSIGAFLGKLAIDGAYNKIGINADSINSGNELTTLFDGKPFSTVDRKALEASLLDLYENFLELVSAGRDISLQELDSIARGRVWTGAQAKEKGLVDELGTIISAINIAAEMAGIEEGEQPNVVYFPDSRLRSQILYGNLPSLSASNEAGALAKNYAQLGELLGQPEMQRVLTELNIANELEGRAQLKASLPRLD